MVTTNKKKILQDNSEQAVKNKQQQQAAENSMYSGMAAAQQAAKNAYNTAINRGASVTQAKKEATKTAVATAGGTSNYAKAAQKKTVRYDDNPNASGTGRTVTNNVLGTGSATAPGNTTAKTQAIEVNDIPAVVVEDKNKGGDKGFDYGTLPEDDYTAPTNDSQPVVEAQPVQSGNNTAISSAVKTVTPLYSAADYFTPATAKFTPSEEYTRAMEYASNLLAQLREGRTSYTDKIASKLQAIEDTPAFKYDFNTDPLFQSKLASSMRSGRQSMEDTMGQASYLTGGYGSTYGQAVGNYAYNNFIQSAYDDLPAYHDIAFKDYQANLDNEYRLLDQYRTSDNTEYNRLADNYDRNFNYANVQWDKEYNNFWKEQDFNEGSRQFAANFNEGVREYDNDDQFRRERAAVGDDQWSQEFDYQKYLDALNYDLRANNSSSSGSRSSGTRSSGNSSTSTLNSTQINSAKKAFQDGGWEGYYAYEDLLPDTVDKSALRSYIQAMENGATNSGTAVTLKKFSETQKRKAKELYNKGGIDAVDDYFDAYGDEYDWDDLLNYLEQNGELPLSQRSYSSVKDTFNWFGGIDNNDIVRDQYGYEYKLKDLYNLLIEDGMTKDEAKEYVMRYNKA